MHINSEVTLDRVTEAVERSHTSLDNPGFCIRCGAEAEGGEPGVYSAEELLLHLAIAG